MRLPELLRHSWTVAAKDLLVEFRSRTAILSAAVFVVLVLVVFNFGRDPTAVSNVDLAPSILWVTFTFAAILALNRAFQLELENQALDGLLLAPIDRSSIYLGKLIANLVFVAGVELIGVPLLRSEEHTSEPSHLVISYAVFCLKKKKNRTHKFAFSYPSPRNPPHPLHPIILFALSTLIFYQRQKP